MALQNIGIANKDDAFYRYKMPRLVTKIEGRGNGIKTNLVNVVDVAKALARSPAYITKFYGCELGAQSKFDDKTNTAIVNGAHETVKLASLLEAFIKKYVQCYSCRNPETKITITKSQTIMLKCAACGFTSNVDMMDKLATFILKNPPLNKKQKGVRKPEKERMKAGESAGMEMKRVKKNGHDAKQAPKKKSSSSDEEVGSSNNSQTDEVDDVFGEKEEVVWLTDTSTEAAQQRIKEQLNTVTSELVMLTVSENQENLQSELENHKTEPTTNFPCFNGEIFKDFKHCIDNGLSAVEVVARLKIDHQNVHQQKVMSAFFEAMFHGVQTGLPKEICRKKHYLLNAITDKHHQTLLLGAIEAHYSTKARIIYKEIALSLKMLYDLDILEEEVIVAWYHRNTSDDVKKFAKPFVDWVQNAELEE